MKVPLTSSCGVRNTNFQSVFNFSTILRATERSERDGRGGGGHEGDDDGGVYERSLREIPLPIKLARTRASYSFPHREATACLGRGQG